jgi:hypothetical protein
VPRSTWRNRLAGHGELAPAANLANPVNWFCDHQPQASTEAALTDEVAVSRSSGRMAV